MPPATTSRVTRTRRSARAPRTPPIPGVPHQPAAPGRYVAPSEAWWLQDMRRLAAVGSAGALVGFVVAGLGSRLAMFVLAALNPQVHGRISDDGFVMGRFDLGATAGLVLFCTVLGVLAGVLYLLLRQLRFGPARFHGAAMVVGPTVVAAAALVHTDGIDFTVLEPRWLAFGLFVLLPLLATWALVGLAEAWLAPTSWFRQGSGWRGLPAVSVLLLFPLAPVLLAAGLLRFAQQRSDTVRRALAHPGVAWVARGVLVVAFVTAAVDLGRDAVTLL